MSAAEGQRVSRGIPFRNAGNISLEIQLQVSSFTDLFSVVPDQVKLIPGQVIVSRIHKQHCEIFVDDVMPYKSRPCSREQKGVEAF